MMIGMYSCIPLRRKVGTGVCTYWGYLCRAAQQLACQTDVKEELERHLVFTRALAACTLREAQSRDTPIDTQAVIGAW